MSKIQELRAEIKWLEGQVETAEKHPTNTAQFYRALDRQRGMLIEKKQQLKELEKRNK